ncbi:TSUP family transporter [Cupriavidus taiwanensis]|uniref:TSUP family transporter n=1 Tax=Cupriavidus taiwanensis TaxID=164546 RepID=UPI003B220FCD
MEVAPGANARWDCWCVGISTDRTLLVSAANAVAVGVFIASNAVRWPETLTMLMGGIIGGYSGARIGRRLTPGTIRKITLIVTSCITLAFLMKTTRPLCCIVDSPNTRKKVLEGWLIAELGRRVRLRFPHLGHQAPADERPCMRH